MNVQRLIETYNTYEEPQDWAEQAKEALGQLQNALEQETTMIQKQLLEIQALHQILGYEGIGVSQEYLDECVAELRKGQEK